MKKAKTLADLKVGESAIVSALIEDEVAIRLMELGCVPGCEVKMNGKAALGGPANVCICGSNLSLRLDEASKVFLN